MAAPEYVPTDPKAVPVYQSPDVVPASWSGARGGDLGVRQPVGIALGHQGPDQGYALTLTKQFEESIKLADGERLDDVMAGAVQIALKRASSYGRAPVVYDVEIGLRVWGFLDDCSQELIEARGCFAGLSNPHHWREMRSVVAMVPVVALRQSPAEVAAAHSARWQSLLDLG
jgi:hypothetical protein